MDTIAMTEPKDEIPIPEVPSKVSVSKYDLMMVTDSLERIQKEMAWISAWIKDKTDKISDKKDLVS